MSWIFYHGISGIAARFSKRFASHLGLFFAVVHLKGSLLKVCFLTIFLLNAILAFKFQVQASAGVHLPLCTHLFRQ